MGRPKRIAAKKATERLRSSVVDSEEDEEFEFEEVTPSKRVNKTYHTPSKSGRPSSTAKNPLVSLDLSRDRLLVAISDVALSARDPLMIIKEQDTNVFNSLEIIEKITNYSRKDNKAKAFTNKPIKINKIQKITKGKKIDRKTSTSEMLPEYKTRSKKKITDVTKFLESESSVRHFSSGKKKAKTSDFRIPTVNSVMKRKINYKEMLSDIRSIAVNPMDYDKYQGNWFDNALYGGMKYKILMTTEEQNIKTPKKSKIEDVKKKSQEEKKEEDGSSSFKKIRKERHSFVPGDCIVLEITFKELLPDVMAILKVARQIEPKILKKNVILKKRLKQAWILFSTVEYASTAFFYFQENGSTMLNISEGNIELKIVAYDPTAFNTRNKVTKTTPTTPGTEEEADAKQQEQEDEHKDDKESGQQLSTSQVAETAPIVPQPPFILPEYPQVSTAFQPALMPPNLVFTGSEMMQPVPILVNPNMLLHPAFISYEAYNQAAAAAAVAAGYSWTPPPPPPTPPPNVSQSEPMNINVNSPIVLTMSAASTETQQLQGQKDDTKK